MRIVFHLRPDLRFSDGSPLRAGDVVRSWLRIIDPDTPSPLSTLLDDRQIKAKVIGADPKEPFAASEAAQTAPQVRFGRDSAGR